MNDIVRPITTDGMVGYDRFDQLVLVRGEGTRQIQYFVHDVRSLTCAICNHGWQPTAESMAGQAQWYLTNEIVHESCLVRHHAFVERAEFFNAICAAKMRFRGLVPEANRYWPESYAEAKKPWYHAELIDHPARIVIGSRKRVVHVEFAAEGGVPFDWYETAEGEFAGVDVTKHFTPTSVMLHAWSDAHVRDFIKRIAKVSGFDADHRGAP